MTNNKRDRQYILSMPPELHNELERVARANNVTEIQLIRQFVKLGLVATSGTEIYIKDGEEYKTIDLFSTVQP